jgi:Sulfotransferase domain
VNRARDDLRDRVARRVQWQPARNAVKRGVHVAAGVRSAGLRLSGRTPPIANIFAASSPKSGSQWAKALFDHPVVRRHTGLLTLPQLDYQVRSPARAFPRGTFVPGFHLSYEEYRRLARPFPHRTVYVFRDPRDVVVSAYFSALRTHRALPEVNRIRDRVRALPLDEGMSFIVEEMAGRLRDMATWVGAEDPEVATFRLEDIAADEHGEVDRMLRHCGVRLTEPELSTVLQDTSREQLQRRDLARRGDGASHYRLERRDFRDLLASHHLDRIEAIVPGLVAELGYSA